MDVHVLHECFAATLSPDHSIRQQAEVHLRQVEKSIGFLGACLDILSSNEVNSGVKTAAALFFKNRILRHWDDDSFNSKEDQSDPLASPPIDNDEKPIIRERLLQTLVKSSPLLRKQLVPVLSRITRSDYPKNWPNLVDNALQLLYSQDLDSAYTGLLCFAEISSSFRWITNNERPELDPIIHSHFPTLLKVGDVLLNEENQQAGEMIVLLLKTFKYATYHDLPLSLQIDSVIDAWGNFHVQVINKEIPKYVLDLDESERRLNPWLKSKKWAYANLYRLFTRYSCVSLSKKFEYEQFKTHFNQHFVPKLLNLYFFQIDQWCSQKLYIGEEALYYLISFLESAITQKQTWILLKPHYELLVSHFIFPLLCPSDSTLENFENDPEDYIHTKLDIYDDNNSPDLAAISLLITLTTKKKKTTLDSILQFAFNLLTQFKDPQTQTLEEAKKLEGSLRLIGSLSDHFINEKSPYYPQMESFLSNLIIPHLQSKFPFIKARTLEIVSKFSDITFTNDETLGNLYRGVLTCFDDDDHLPVKLEAALALQSFVKIPQFKDALSLVIVPTMQKLLKLSNTIDAEAISGVMQELVEVFSEQLQPFGVDLMINLSEQFLKLAKELNDASNVDSDDIDNGYDDLTDKQMAALGLLNTMITVLLSFESSVEVVFKLEETFFPVVEFVFKNNIEDFFREAGELIENSTFLTKSVSPIAWKCFELIVGSLTNGIAILYLEDLMPPLNNFLVYGAEYLQKNEPYVSALLQLFNHILTSDDCETSELGYGGEIIQKVILALGVDSKPFIEPILSTTINAVVNAEEMNNFFAINMIDTIISGLVHNASITLITLGKGNFILPFFNLWFQYIGKFTRVYDMKLSILGLLSIITLNEADFVSLQIDTIIPQLGHQLATLMSKLPNAIQDLEKRRKDYEGEELTDGAYGEAFNDDDDEWENEDVDEDADAAASDDYLNFLAEEAKKLRTSGAFDDDDDDDEVAEDALANTILDNVNVFLTFKETVLSIQSSGSPKYQLIFGNLNSDEQTTLQNVIEL